MITIEDVEKAMLEGTEQSFTTIYSEELADCIPDLIEFIKKKSPEGLTKAMIERNGYKQWKSCLITAPSLNGTNFGKIVLDAWVQYFFEVPELMELVGIIAEQENKQADKRVIEEMKNFKTGSLVLRSTKKGPLTGLHVVFTGASDYFTGEDVERFLEKNGAITSHTVTAKTELLITGKRPASSKLVKAKNLGIKIIKEEDLIKEAGLTGLPKMK